jgi:hypothetical protein
MRALALVLLLTAAACGGSSNAPMYCDANTPCTGNDVCARTHECLAPDQVHSVTIHWTLGGQPPTATTCAGISELEVGYVNSSDATDQVVFSPVSCAEGAFPNDAWPTRYDQAFVTAVAPGNSTTNQAAIPAGAMVDVTIDVTHP